MIKDTQVSQILNDYVQKPSDDFFERFYLAEEFEEKTDDTTLITIGARMNPFITFDPIMQYFGIPIEFKASNKISEKTVILQIFETMENYLRHEDYFKSKWYEEGNTIHSDYFTPTDFDLYYKNCYDTIRNCYQEKVRPGLINSLTKNVNNLKKNNKGDER